MYECLLLFQRLHDMAAAAVALDQASLGSGTPCLNDITRLNKSEKNIFSQSSF